MLVAAVDHLRICYAKTLLHLSEVAECVLGPGARQRFPPQAAKTHAQNSLVR